MNYMYESYLSQIELGTEAAHLDDLRHRLNPEKPLEALVEKSFPITNFGNPQDTLHIPGSRKLLDAFEALDDVAVKTDCQVRYENLQFVEMDGPGNITLQFPVDNDTLNANSVYTFYSEFLDFFRITKFVNYCYSRGYNDLIEHNLQQLFLKNGSVEKQFRLITIQDGQTYGLRAITSTQYNNYDNNVVVYLSLLSLHKYASENNRQYYVHSAHLSDSFLRIVYELEQPISIEGVGDVYLGLSVSNGEIRNYKFKTELRYRIVDEQKEKSFNGVYDSPLFSIRHDMTLSTVDTQLRLLTNLEKYETSVIEFILNLRNIQTLTDDAAFSIFHNLVRQIKACSDISSRTSESFSIAETNHLIKNTLSLIDLFDIAQRIPTDMDEKVFVERIFHKVLKDFLRTRNG